MSTSHTDRTAAAGANLNAFRTHRPSYCLLANTKPQSDLYERQSALADPHRFGRVLHREAPLTKWDRTADKMGGGRQLPGTACASGTRRCDQTRPRLDFLIGMVDSHRTNYWIGDADARGDSWRRWEHG